VSAASAEGAVIGAAPEWTPCGPEVRLVEIPSINGYGLGVYVDPATQARDGAERRAIAEAVARMVPTGEGA
jgi:hypothetical protein